MPAARSCWNADLRDLPDFSVIDAGPYYMPLTVAGQWRIFTAFPNIAFRFERPLRRSAQVLDQYNIAEVS